MSKDIMFLEGYWLNDIPPGCSGSPTWISTAPPNKKKAGRPATYDFDTLKDEYLYECDGYASPLIISVPDGDDIKKRLVKISTALYLYKKRRGFNWDTAVRRGDGVIKVYRLI